MPLALALALAPHARASHSSPRRHSSRQLSAAPLLELQSLDGQLRANGKPFRLKGVTWWGAESNLAVLDGLTHRSLDDLLAMIARSGFNALRLPFLHQHVLFDDAVPAAGFNAALNPFLLKPSGQPVSYVEMLQTVAKRAAAHGLLVWLVAHSLEALWYSRSISESTILDSWSSIGSRMCAQWNVVGMDLKNKPSAASWGMGQSTDWDEAAVRLGNHVLRKCPRWLIGVEGVGQKPGATQDEDMAFAAMYPKFFDGENLVGARRKPIKLSDHSRLVYMPHTYGPGVQSMPYMESDDFPDNTEQVWQEHFLFLRKSSETRQAASIILNIGGPFESSPRDMEWQIWAVQYCLQHGISVFYDGMNPRSGVGGDAPSLASAPHAVPTLGDKPLIKNNTGGLMMEDWTNMRAGKMHLLAQLPSTPLTAVIDGTTGSAAPNPGGAATHTPRGAARGGEEGEDALGEDGLTDWTVPFLAPPPAASTLEVFSHDEPEPSHSPLFVGAAALFLALLLGRMGAFRRVPRDSIDAAAPASCLPLLAVLWAVLSVPSSSPLLPTAGEPPGTSPARKPATKRKGAKGKAKKLGSAERGGPPLLSAEDDERSECGESSVCGDDERQPLSGARKAKGARTKGKKGKGLCANAMASKQPAGDSSDEFEEPPLEKGRKLARSSSKGRFEFNPIDEELEEARKREMRRYEGEM
ncbi:hypothetical protein AB1Y20_017539 [Prymnesium parvum]|uniref:Glycoside hydrolase family 5 domain-containing protein n=1 Tax=Prymnesium parvum TaxID=97485 RepID=A0AB34JKU0_PRYPA